MSGPSDAVPKAGRRQRGRPRFEFAGCLAGRRTIRNRPTTKWPASRKSWRWTSAKTPSRVGPSARRPCAICRARAARPAKKPYRRQRRGQCPRTQPPPVAPCQRPGASSSGSSLAGRYVDDKGKPLTDPNQQPYEEFRMMPIDLKVVIEQKDIPRLLAECANSAMRIDVRRRADPRGATARRGLGRPRCRRSFVASPAAKTTRPLQRTPGFRLPRHGPRKRGRRVVRRPRRVLLRGIGRPRLPARARGSAGHHLYLQPAPGPKSGETAAKNGGQAASAAAAPAATGPAGTDTGRRRAGHPARQCQVRPSATPPTPAATGVPTNPPTGTLPPGGRP